MAQRHKKNEKKKPLSGFIDSLQLPYGTLRSSVNFEIHGNREIIIEGSRGVLEYNENTIKINAGKFIVCFSGRGLCIKCLSDSSMVIVGCITQIEYLT